MPTVVPAILEKDKAGFLEKDSIIKLLQGVERVQVDFADGKFVNNTTLQVDEIDSLNPVYTWEAHLMLEAPSDFLDYQICGFSTVLIHYEAYKTEAEVKQALEEIKKLKMKPGLVINPKTPVSVCKNFEGLADQFLIMSVEPGFQGAPFIESSFEKIKELRSAIPSATIEVDGGVKIDNIKALRDAGADYLAAGSSLFSALSPAEAYKKLSEEIL